MTFEVEGQLLHAHRIVLLCSRASEVFRAMLRTPMRETRTPHATIVVEDVSYEVFKLLVAYLYTGEAEVPPHLASEVLLACERWMCYPLQLECAHLMVQSLCAETLWGDSLRIHRPAAAAPSDRCPQRRIAGANRRPGRCAARRRGGLSVRVGRPAEPRRRERVCRIQRRARATYSRGLAHARLHATRAARGGIVRARTSHRPLPRWATQAPSRHKNVMMPR